MKIEWLMKTMHESITQGTLNYYSRNFNVIIERLGLSHATVRVEVDNVVIDSETVPYINSSISYQVEKFRHKYNMVDPAELRRWPTELQLSPYGLGCRLLATTISHNGGAIGTRQMG